MKLDPGNAELIAQKQETLQDAIEKTKGKLETLREAHKQAQQQLESGDLGKQQQNALQQEIVRTEQELKRLAEEAVRTNSTIAGLSSIGSTLTGAGRAISSTGKALTLGLTMPIVGAGTAAARLGMGFDASMSRVQAISRVSEKDFERLKNKAREIGATTQFTATEAAQAMIALAQAGWKTEDMLSGVDGVMNLAASSGVGLSTSAGILVNTLNSFGLTAKDSARAADTLTASFNNSNQNLPLLADALKDIGSVARTAGWSLEDTVQAIGHMSDNGTQGSEAGNALKATIVSLLSPTKKQKQALVDLALATEEYSNVVDPKKVTKAQEKVAEATEKLQAAEAKYNNIIKGQSTNSTAAISAHNNLEKAQIRAKNAANAVSEAQKKYNTAVKEHGAKSEEALKAGKNLAKAQDKLKLTTLDLNTAQAKYNNALKSGSSESSKVVSARNAVEKAERNLANAQNELAEAQKGTHKSTGIYNRLISDADGNTRDLDSVMTILRATLGKFNVDVVDSNGELKEFDTIISEVSKRGASLKQVELLKNFGTIIGKHHLAGIMALGNTSEESYKKLGGAIKNASYDIDSMTAKLKESDVDWAKYLNTSSFKSAEDAFDDFAKTIAVRLSDAKKNGQDTETVVKSIATTYNMTAEDAKKAVDIVSGSTAEFNGAAEQTAKTMLNNLSGQFTILKSALQELGLQISDALKPAISGIVDKVQGFVEKLQNLDEEARNNIIRWGLFLAAIGPVLTIVGKLTSGFGLLFTAASKIGGTIILLQTQAALGVGTGAKLATMFSTLASGPMLVVIAAIAAVAAAFIHLWNTNEEFRNNCIQIWEQVKTAFQKLWDSIAYLLDALKPLFEVAINAIKAVWEEFCNFLAPIFEGVLVGLGGIFEGAVKILSGILTAFAALFTGDWDKFWEGIKQIFEGIWDAIAGFFEAQWTIWSGLIEAFFNLIAKLWKAGWEGIKAVFEMIWNMIASFFSLAWDGIKAVVVGTLDIIASIISSVFKAIASVFSTVWDGIKKAFCAVWDAIKDYVMFALKAIGSIIDAAFKIVTVPFMFIWENCKDFVFEIWDAISEGISTALKSIAGFIEKIWTGVTDWLADCMKAIGNSIKEKWDWIYDNVSSIVTGIYDWICEKWNAIKDYISSISDGIRDYLSELWETISQSISSAIDNISQYIDDKWESIKTTTLDVWDSISDYVLGLWDDIKNGVSEKLSAVWNDIKDTFSNIWDTVSGAVKDLISVFDFDWELPKIKLPHFSIKGEFSLVPPSVPYLSVDWYKKAMNDAYILNSPTIFGMSGGRLLGGGEAGSEAVVGTNKLMEMITAAVGSVSGGGTTVIPVYIGQERIEEIIVKANRSVNYRSGGR